MNFKRLLLIIPPQYLVMEGFRTAIVALAAYVKRKHADLEIKLLDLSTFSSAAARTEIAKVMADGSGRTLAGISTVTADYQAALTVARNLKEIDPDIITIFGGHHASGDAKVILKSHPLLVDFVICGEGEIPLDLFITAYPKVERVPGLAFWAKDRVVRNPSPVLLDTPDLDCVPLAYEGSELATSPGKFEHVTYVSARGCPLLCSFCAVGNQKIRYKSISQVTSDIRTLVEQGFSRIAFEDNFFAHNRERTRALCESLTKLRADGLKFSWDCQTRIESIDRTEIIGWMQKAGCEAVYLGVESLNESVLKFLGKAANPKRYLSSLMNRVAPSLLDSQLDCYINLQFGLPGEFAGPDEIENTVETMKRLGEMAAARGKSITVFPQLFVVYPGTSHFHQYVHTRVLPEDVFETFTLWETEQKPILSWLGETFAHGTGGIPLGILDKHSLMHHRKYKIDERATETVSTTINRLNALPGVTVFRYGQYLVKENSNVPPKQNRHHEISLPAQQYSRPRLVVSNSRMRTGTA